MHSSSMDYLKCFKYVNVNEALNICLENVGAIQHPNYQNQIFTEDFPNQQILTYSFLDRVLIVWISVLLKCEAGREWIHRNPRYLPFPMGLGNKLQIIAGFGIPVEIASDSLTFGYIIKTNYALPTNASQFTNPDEAFADFSKKRMRWSFYEVMINLFQSLSLGGRDCLLRSICEAAYTPLGHNGVLGEILHIILTPSSTPNEIMDDPEDYTKAEETGRASMTSYYCSRMFSNCTLSLLDIISKIDGSLFDDKFLQNMKYLK